MEESKPNSISHIYKNIYISDIKNACDIQKLKKCNIKAILYLGAANKDTATLNLYKNSGITHKFLKIRDTIDSLITDCFEPAWSFINKHIQRDNILIHCVKGISRSPTIVAYYLTRKLHERMKIKGYVEHVVEDILYLIHNIRPCSNPNQSFVRQLKQYETSTITIIKKENSRAGAPPILIKS